MQFESSKARVFCHRGLWENIGEQNTPLSFAKAIEGGFSIETDLHAFLGSAVVSHDLPTRDAVLGLRDLLSLDAKFALNLKVDGLSEEIQSHLDLLLGKGSFVFDGSIPEMLVYRYKGIPLALRLSEFERELSWDCDTIWLDSFHSDWWLDHPDFMETVQGKTLIVVSPEIHGRNPTDVWNFLTKHWSDSDVKFAICTDEPVKFFEQL